LKSLGRDFVDKTGSFVGEAPRPCAPLLERSLPEYEF
jgi:hypothetical protein